MTLQHDDIIISVPFYVKHLLAPSFTKLTCFVGFHFSDFRCRAALDETQTKILALSRI